jgi:hypothetical protein
MEVSGQHHAPASLDRAATEKKVGTAQQPVWAFWRRKPSLASAVIRTPHRSLVTILTELSRLPLRHGSDRPNACQSGCDWYQLYALKTYSGVTACWETSQFVFLNKHDLDEQIRGGGKKGGPCGSCGGKTKCRETCRKTTNCKTEP